MCEEVGDGRVLVQWYHDKRGIKVSWRDEYFALLYSCRAICGAEAKKFPPCNVYKATEIVRCSSQSPTNKLEL